MDEKMLLYVIDDEYRFVYTNAAFRETYPNVKCGQKCYEELGRLKEPCDYCPLVRNDFKNIFFNERSDEWVKAQAAEIEWEGKPGYYSVLVNVSRDKSASEGILADEIKLKRQLDSKQEDLRASREENLQGLAIIQALSRDFGNVYCVNLDTDRFKIYRLDGFLLPSVRENVNNSDHTYTYCINSYIDECVYPDDRDDMKKCFEIGNLKDTLNKKRSFVYNYRIARDGSTIYYQVKAVGIEEKGQVVTAIIGFTNVDEETKREIEKQQLLKDALSQAEYANRAKTAFLSNMSHEIRTPMNAILGMTAIAAMHIDEKERVMDSLNKITLSGKHLLGLINSVLDMSRIESGRISLNEEEFNLSDSIEGLIALFQTQMKLKKQELKADVAPIEHEHVIGDSQRLQQILINIMGNAVKFTPEEGTISISIREKKSDIKGCAYYEFVFQDTGIGMEKKFIERIFEPFAREDNTRTSKSEGTGLGMSIAVSIARMMNGDILVESEQGRGSKFTVYVYLKINNVSEENTDMLAELPVLVVDDEEYACENACEILNSLSMKAEYVLSGEAAIDRARNAQKNRDPFSVVIVDWKMPDMDGLETTKQIRKIVGDEIPIIILSAYDWADIEQEAIAAGVNAFIEKPLFKSRLAHVLKEVLECNQRLEQNNDINKAFCANFEGKHVLIVEDNELNSEIALELLKLLGINADITHNGREAVEKVLEMSLSYYNLILMDIQMPVMNGYQATNMIRNLENDSNRHIPIIAMTADAFADDVRKSREAGMDGHISKPIDVMKLQKVMEEFLK